LYEYCTHLYTFDVSILILPSEIKCHLRFFTLTLPVFYVFFIDKNSVLLFFFESVGIELKGLSHELYMHIRRAGYLIF
jgi:hypothetical protein